MNKEISIFIRKVGDMREECNERIHQPLPRKAKDLESFTIPVVIGNPKHTIRLKANINLIPLSLMKKNRKGDLKAKCDDITNG